MDSTTTQQQTRPPAPAATERLEFPDNRLAAALFGEFDAHLKLVEERLRVVMHPLGNCVVITAPGQRAKRARQLLENLYASLTTGVPVNRHTIEAEIQALDEPEATPTVASDPPLFRTPRRAIYARNPRQRTYIQLLSTRDLIFATGPAGTGKTYLAVAAAVRDYLEGRVARIILTRPAVEAGERLGFLPGDMQAKVDPFLRPLYDALNDMVGFDKVERMLDRNVLEIAPLAFMRGRTLEEAFIILDEAQNATAEQMKMFLTRLGEGSRAAVSGDITQVDLPRGPISGLRQALGLLHDMPEVGFVPFSQQDVVRHPLVKKIVLAYERAESTAYAKNSSKTNGSGFSHA